MTAELVRHRHSCDPASLLHEFSKTKAMNRCPTVNLLTRMTLEFLSCDKLSGYFLVLPGLRLSWINNLFPEYLENKFSRTPCLGTSGHKNHTLPSLHWTDGWGATRSSWQRMPGANCTWTPWLPLHTSKYLLPLLKPSHFWLVISPRVSANTPLLNVTRMSPCPGTRSNF